MSIRSAISMILVVALLAFLLVVSVSFPGAPQTTAAQMTFAIGDVFAAVGSGRIKVFDPNGNLKATLDTTSASAFTTGMCFEATMNLYGTNFSANNMTKFNPDGTISIHPFGSGFNAQPESCIVDAQGNIYVGQPDGSRDILKFSPSGAFLASFDAVVTNRGTDWIDLAADQCTMFYTSEGTTIKRFNVCTNTQLPDFATGLPGASFALRIRQNGDVLVASSAVAVRLNSSGQIVQTYTPAPNEFLFALNLDPDGTSFWTAGLFSGAIYRVDIATGNVIKTFNATPFTQLAGLSIKGEITSGGGGGPGFDVCLQNDTDGSVMKINSTTGEYSWCCGATFPVFTLTGTGTITRKGSGFTLTDFRSDRRVLAQYDTSTNIGKASLQSPQGTLRCTIQDRNITNNSCNCPQ